MPRETARSSDVDDRAHRWIGIGELARRTGVTPRTIRYWEDEDVLPPPPRSEGGTRRYPPEFVLLVEGAVVLRELGFGVDETRLISRFSRGITLAPDERARTQRAIDRLLGQLQRRLRVLEFVRLAAGTAGAMTDADRAQLAAMLAIDEDP